MAADIPQPKTYKPYIEVFGGFDFLSRISGTNSFFVGSGTGKLNSNIGDFAVLAIGVDLKNSWRVEAELSRSYNGIQNFTYKNGNVNTYEGGGVNQTYAVANL